MNYKDTRLTLRKVENGFIVTTWVDGQKIEELFQEQYVDEMGLDAKMAVSLLHTIRHWAFAGTENDFSPTQISISVAPGDEWEPTKKKGKK